MENEDGEGDEDAAYLQKAMLPCSQWRGKTQHDKGEETGAYKTADNVRLTEGESQREMKKQGRF